ncbi:hypothetical protein CVT24_002046 [Panaeolus cyanescens]|uniref:Uncharacterized protein n=1 Tax=Panaeolus cyanescens TaxID=181874 RepID=A0A409YHJ4_9AGAR|nr:hypothetical protein CVT24_002046 [Panaeolus cyanescens]
MNIHTPSSSPPKLYKFHEPAPHFVQKSILDEEPAWVVDIALQALQDSGIEPAEWGALLYRRMGVPITIKDYFYLIPDDNITAASDILTSLGLPLSKPSRLHMLSEGDMAAKGIHHRISRSTLPSSVSHIVLYPLSFSTVLPSELERRPPLHISSSYRCPTIMVPRRTATYASLIRMMSRYSQHCATRTLLSSDLSELVGYDLLSLEGGYVDPEDSAEWERLDIDGRIQRAVALVRQWSWEEEWREGEQWIGDALAWIVEGTADIANLPCAP